MTHWRYPLHVMAARHMVAAIAWHARRDEPLALSLLVESGRVERQLAAFDARARYWHQRRIRAAREDTP